MNNWACCVTDPLLGTRGEGGQLRVTQTDGLLKVEKGVGPYSLRGGADRNGRFRFGAEISTGQDTLRVLWQGKFHSNSLEFKRGMTAVKGANDVRITQLTPTAVNLLLPVTWLLPPAD